MNLPSTLNSGSSVENYVSFFFLPFFWKIIIRRIYFLFEIPILKELHFQIHKLQNLKTVSA